MRVVFFGTPEPAAVALLALLGSHHDVAAVVTRPDRPKGRGRALTPSAAKRAAEAAGVPVEQPSSPREAGFADRLARYSPEALAVVAYGHVLPPDVLVVAPAVNVHFSLLPRYRGAAPVQRALMDGVTETGVTVFALEPTVDTGPILAQERVAVGSEETAGELLERLAPIGAGLLVSALDAIASGASVSAPQHDAGASLAPKITPTEAQISWSSSAPRIANLVRAMNPAPGAWTVFRGRRLLVWRARAVPGEAPPGTVAGGEGLAVGTGEGLLHIVEVQPEGKRRMTAADFVRGYRPAPGEALE